MKGVWEMSVSAMVGVCDGVVSVISLVPRCVSVSVSLGESSVASWDGGCGREREVEVIAGSWAVEAMEDK
jgi:hypothetical protein